MSVEKRMSPDVVSATTTSSARSGGVTSGSELSAQLASGKQRPPFEQNITVEAIPLRQSNLTLSKFDERMPSKVNDAKNSTLNRTMRSSSQTYQSRPRLGKFAFRRGSYDERLLPSRPRLSTIHHAPNGNHHSQLSYEGTQDGKSDGNVREPSVNTSIGLNGTSSILQEMVTRRRQLMYMVGSMCTFVFLTGCIITAICFSTGTDNMIPGQVIGLILFVGGGVGCIVVAISLSRPDRELQRKIERREKMFSTFKKIAYQNEERRHSTLLNEKLVAKINAKGDDPNANVTS